MPVMSIGFVLAAFRRHSLSVNSSWKWPQVPSACTMQCEGKDRLVVWVLTKRKSACSETHLHSGFLSSDFPNSTSPFCWFWVFLFKICAFAWKADWHRDSLARSPDVPCGQERAKLSQEPGAPSSIPARMTRTCFLCHLLCSQHISWKLSRKWRQGFVLAFWDLSVLKGILTTVPIVSHQLL